MTEMLKLFFAKHYRLTTLLVIIACGVMVRLGFWQLDRLAQRQALNAEITQKLAAPPLVLSGAAVTDDPKRLKFRPATVRGIFDHSQEVVLQGQSWQGQPGVHLITPLMIEGGNQAVLVDRGWIPTEAASPEQRRSFATKGVVEVSGLIQLSQPRPNAPPWQAPELTIFRVDIERLQNQMPYPLLPLFIVQSSQPSQSELPYQREPDLDLSNGPHLGYAIQWFAFALILAVGYVKLTRQQRPAQTDQVAPLSISMEA